MKFTDKQIGSILFRTIIFIFQMAVLIAGAILVIAFSITTFDLSFSSQDVTHAFSQLLGSAIIILDVGLTFVNMVAVIIDYRDYFDRF